MWRNCVWEVVEFDEGWEMEEVWGGVERWCGVGIWEVSECNFGEVYFGVWYGGWIFWWECENCEVELFYFWGVWNDLIGLWCSDCELLC